MTVYRAGRLGRAPRSRAASGRPGAAGRSWVAALAAMLRCGGRLRSVVAPRTPRVGARDSGSYTAELAVALPSLLFVLAWALLGISVADAAFRCQDATRSGARALARGEPRTAVVAATRKAAPADARVSVRRTGETAVVGCAARVELFGLHTFAVHARAVTPLEAVDTAVPTGLSDGAGGRR